jgi:hypothetical protein
VNALSPFYCIPRDRLEGRSAEMAFADAVYCLASTQGWAFEEISRAQALDLEFQTASAFSGLDPGTVNEEADQAARLGWLRRTGMGDRSTEQVYLLDYGELANGNGAPRKPVNYVTNGWLRTVYQLSRSYLPQRVLNLVWLMRFGPEPRDVSVEELRVRAAPANSRPLSRTRIVDALDLLERLGILIPEGGGYRLDRECFDAPSPSPDEVQGRWDRRRLLKTDTFLQLSSEDTRRAQLALDILLAGRFDPEHDLRQIYDDLRWAGEQDDLDLLLTLARRRPRHNHQPGWDGLWRNFLKRRMEQRASRQRLRSAESVVRFDRSSEHAVLLGLVGPSVEEIGDLWLFARLRSKLETRQLARVEGAAPQVRLHLNWGASVELLSTSLNLGQANHWSVPLRALGERAPLHFTLLAYTPQPVAGMWLEAWLEAEPRS